MAGKGLPFIGKMNEFLGKVLHPTVQKVGNSRAGLDVLNRGYFLIQTNAFVVEAGSSDSLLVLTGHPFKEGDGIRIKTAANPIKEIEIVIDEIIDANTVKFAGYLSHPLSAGDLIYGRRPITETFASDGTALATLSYLKDNISVPVARDTVIPSLSTALPVEIMGANGMVLNVTTGDLNIQSTHEDRTVNAVNVPGDSIKIGNGLAGALARYLSIVTNGTSGLFEAQVKDADVLAQAVLIKAKTDNLDVALSTRNLEATQLLIKAKTDNLDVALSTRNLEATQLLIKAKTDNLDVALSTRNLEATQLLIKAKTDNLDVALSTRNLEATQLLIKAKTDNLNVALSTLNKESTQLSLLGSLTESAPENDTASSGLNGRLQRIAQRLTTLIGQIPSALGANIAANSLSIIPSTNAKFLTKPFTTTTTYAENLNITTQVAMAAPENSIGCLIMADDVNANNLRVVQNGTASLTSGMPLQAGRDIKFDCGQNLSFISDNGGIAGASVKVYVQWFIQA